MNTSSFHKTLLTFIISGACASTLGADLSVRTSTAADTQVAAQTQNSEAAISANNQNDAAAQASVNETAVANIRTQTESSAKFVTALAGTIKNESQVESVDTTVSATAENQSSGDFNVSTLDGIAIDLSGNSDNSVTAQLDSTLDTTLKQSAESGIELGEAALGTTLNVLNNTEASVAELGDAVDVSAAAQSSADAASAVEFDEATIGSVNSATESSTTSSLVGGLL